MKPISNTSSLQLFQMLRFSILLGISILLAKSGLSQNEIGRYETFLFLSTIVTFFWTDSVVQSLLSNFDRSHAPLPLWGGAGGGVKNPLFFNAFFALLLMGLISAGSLWIFFTVPGSQHADNITGFVPPLVLFIVLNTPSFLVEYIYMLKEKPKQIIFYGAVTYIIQLVAVISPVFFNMGIETAFYGLDISAAIRFSWLLVLLAKYSEFKLSPVYFKPLITTAAPLILYSLITGAEDLINGMIVRLNFDDSVFAIYRYGAKELPVALLLANALSNSMVPEFSGSGNIAGALSALKKKSLQLMHLVFPVALIFLLFSDKLFPFVFNREFSESAGIFNIFLLLIIPRLVFPQTILLGMKKNGVILWGAICEFSVNLLVGLSFVGVLGIKGVAFGLVLGFFAEKIFLSVYCYCKLDIPISSFIPLRFFLFYSVLLLLAFIFF